MGENEWVGQLRLNIDARVKPLSADGWTAKACVRAKLAYAHEIVRYDKDDVPTPQSTKYETDILLYDERENGDWVPRVIVECKLGISTHDVLTYSSKANTHKHVHPYLRYGLLIGGYAKGLPARAIRHGAYFDFMMFWVSAEWTPTELDELIAVLTDEISASRLLSGLLTKGSPKAAKPRSLHRRLVVK
jgi:hypothetical protein